MNGLHPRKAAQSALSMLDVLADTHMQLGDVAMEQANFESAVNDYAAALKYLTQCDQVGGQAHTSQLQAPHD